MKKRKIFSMRSLGSVLLIAAMVLGLMPLSVKNVYADETNESEIILSDQTDGEMISEVRHHENRKALDGDT